jgi:8-oxo-dGTP diphosphatase
VSVPEHAESTGPTGAATGFSASEQAAWYAGLPTMYGSAAALFTNWAGQVLLVKPNYRDHWTLPGGILEDGEPPHAACRREVAEEIGLDLPAGPLLAVDWSGPAGERPRPIMHFIFDGGVLADDVPIRLQAEELDDYRFVGPGELDRYLPPFLRARVSGALSGRADGAVYLPQRPG